MNLAVHLLRYSVYLDENPPENIYTEQNDLLNEPSTDHGPNKPIRFHQKVSHTWFDPEAFQDECAVI